jgi:hypothetical protein
MIDQMNSTFLYKNYSKNSTETLMAWRLIMKSLEIWTTRLMWLMRTVKLEFWIFNPTRKFYD